MAHPESFPAGAGRYAAADVHYPRGGGAIAALVVAGDSTFADIVAQYTVRLERVATYRPGFFAERELPGLRAVLAWAGRVDLLLVDGYVQLDPTGRPGLGARVNEAFGVPVIGVAKTLFRGAHHAIPVLRGRSIRPLYVTAVDVPLDRAAELVRCMAGQHRVPDALRRVDALSRAGR
jgi:deoxyribonuclease V